MLLGVFMKLSEISNQRNAQKIEQKAKQNTFSEKKIPIDDCDYFDVL